MSDKTFRLQKNRESALQLLKIVVSVLDDFNIKYYLDFGTLIGAIRDKGLIPWDDDIDISLLKEEDYHKIPKVLDIIKKRYKLRTYIATFESSNKKRKKREEKVYQEKVIFTDDNNFQIAKVRNNKFLSFGRGNTCIDIFFKYKFEAYSYWVAYGQVNRIPLEYTSEDLIEINFYDMKCKIPKVYDKYLTYKYGDWKTEKQDWSHSTDDFSIDKEIIK